MGDSQLSTPDAASYELALANRKLVTVVMGMTLLMGLVACLAYLAGRSVTGIRAQQAAPAVIPPPVIVEKSAVAAVAPPAPAAEPAPAPPAPAPPTPAASVPAATLTGSRLFLQVAAGEISDFQPLRSELEHAGLPLEVVLIENKHRLLVGPIKDAEQKRKFEAQLESGNHPYFARRL